ncbi:MAG: glycoside hydrolase family 26 protein [Bacteroides sp.]|nr:glycoside hydrolase family 26 protein [Bacteroides sp.]
MVNGRKITALTLAAVMLCASLSGCGGGESADGKSNPVAVDEFGDVDMEAALAYETDVDALLEKLEAKEVDPSKPVSENSNKKTLEVFNFLRENYGSNTITAQQMFNTKQLEDAVYYKYTDDLPAIKGFDFIFITSSGDATQVDDAIEWHTKSGGLITMTWHWNVPRDIDNPNMGKAFYSDEITNFSLQNAVTPGTKEYEVVIHDIDLIAIQLQRMEAAGVPVIWRPLHEASGAWFWWGGVSRDGSTEDAYKKLWYTIFDRLENYHKLTNLIWVWNGQSSRLQVNPNTYDITGTDVYPTKEDHSPQLNKYNELKEMTYDGKMIALTECGYIPDINEMREKNAMWLYSMPWNGDFIYRGTGGSPELDGNGMPYINTERLSEEFLKEYMASENVITWSKLPQWEGTEKNIPEDLDLLFKLAELAARD